MNETEEDTAQRRATLYLQGTNDTAKMPVCPGRSADSRGARQDSNGIFHRNRKTGLKSGQRRGQTAQTKRQLLPQVALGEGLGQGGVSAPQTPVPTRPPDMKCCLAQGGSAAPRPPPPRTLAVAGRCPGTEALKPRATATVLGPPAYSEIEATFVAGFSVDEQLQRHVEPKGDKGGFLRPDSSPGAQSGLWVGSAAHPAGMRKRETAL